MFSCIVFDLFDLLTVTIHGHCLHFMKLFRQYHINCHDNEGQICLSGDLISNFSPTFSGKTLKRREPSLTHLIIFNPHSWTRP